MTKLSTLNKFTITAVCVALCIVLPIALHGIPNAGTLFSPMHIPALLCGIICGWPYGLLCGLIGPLLSSLLTSMPAMAKLPFMMIELAMYGAVCGLMMHLLHSGKLILDIYASLLLAMLSGRIVAGIIRAFFLAGESYSWSLWATSYFISCLPGIIVQLILIPALYLALERAKLIPVRYLPQNTAA